MKIRQLLVDIRILDSHQLKAKRLLEMLPHQKSLPHSSPAIQCQKLRLLARQKTIKLLPFPRPPDDVRFTQSGQIYQKTTDLASLNFMRLPILLRFVLRTSFPSVKIQAHQRCNNTSAQSNGLGIRPSPKKTFAPHAWGLRKKVSGKPKWPNVRCIGCYDHFYKSEDRYSNSIIRLGFEFQLIFKPSTLTARLKLC